MPFGKTENDSVLDLSKESQNSYKIDLENSFFLYNYNRSLDYVYICTNGLIALNYSSCPTNISKYYDSKFAFVAGLSVPLDTENGNIFYRESTSFCKDF